MDFTKIALYAALWLCIVLIVIGVYCWGLPIDFIFRFALSSAAICAGIAFGAIVLEGIINK